jgi:STE24 endopeptidase
MQPIAIAFLAAATFAFALQAWLLLRQMAHLRGRPGAPGASSPKALPASRHRRAADYALAKARVSLFELALGTALMVWWTLGGGLDTLDRLWRNTGLGGMAAGIGVMGSLLTVGALVDLPIAAYRTFSIERRLGFNRARASTFLADAAKALALTLLLGLPLAAALLWLAESAGPYWWIGAWAACALFAAAMVWAFPRIIAPLFNRFTPLQDGALGARIEALLRGTGFGAQGVYVMDGSRRSEHGNAYVMGLGRQKRIVLFDTLVRALTPSEVEAVLAHELGHFHHGHVVKGLGWLGLSGLGICAAMGWLVAEPGFCVGLGLTQPSPYGALSLLLVCAPLLASYAQPALAALSRFHERQADDYAAAQVGAQHLASALAKLYRENAMTETPDPLYSAFFDTHPPLAVRVARLIGHTTPTTREAYA